MSDMPSKLNPTVGWSIEVNFSLIARLCFAFEIYFYRPSRENGKICLTSKCLSHAHARELLG